MEKEIRNIFRRFVSVSGYSLLVMVIAGPVLHIIDGINNIQIAAVGIFAFAAALSSLVFISRTELHGAAWWIREIFCLLINMAVALPITYYAGFWHSVTGMIIIILVIVVIAFGNHLIEFLFDLKTANQLNRRIRELKQGQ